MAIYNTNISGGLNTKDCTAKASDILKGKTAAVGKEIVTGTMPDNGNVGSAISNGVLKAGYTSGGVIANLSEENIKEGVTICGKVGSYCQISNVTIKKIGTKQSNITFAVMGTGATGSRYNGRTGIPCLSVDLLSSYGESSALDDTGYYCNRIFVLKSMVVTKGVIESDTSTNKISSPVKFYFASYSDNNHIKLNGMSGMYGGKIDIEWGNECVLYYSSSSPDKKPEGYVEYDEYEIIY